MVVPNSLLDFQANFKTFLSIFFATVSVEIEIVQARFFVASGSTEDKFLLTSDHLLKDICLFPSDKRTNKQV